MLYSVVYLMTFDMQWKGTEFLVSRYIDCIVMHIILVGNVSIILSQSKGEVRELARCEICEGSRHTNQLRGYSLYMSKVPGVKVMDEVEAATLNNTVAIHH